MVLVGNPLEEEGAEDEEFDFDPEADGETRAPIWYAMARFYSSIQNPRGLFDEMGAAWRLERPIGVRNLGDNRFILEFETEHHYKYALDGGPWRHKGDALIVVPYDGASRPSEVVIDSINIWVRFYDVPVTLMSSAFTMVLAKKVSSDVLEIGAPVRDFLRARVAYKLEEPLKASVEARIKDIGIMSFDVRYENVPFFCFICGRLGHSERECPDEEEEAEEEDGEEDEPKRRKFGDWLRKSPFKKGKERNLVVPAAPSRVNRALNFSGAQLNKVKGVTSASSDTGGKRKCREGGAASSKKLPPEVSNALSNSMSKVSVKEGTPVLNSGLPSARERVSGLDSFADSSGQSASGGRQSSDAKVYESRSIYDRLQAAKQAHAKLSADKKKGLKGSSPTKESGKHKKSKLNTMTGSVDQSHMLIVNNQGAQGGVATGGAAAAGDQMDFVLENTLMDTDGGLQASTEPTLVRPVPLTGAHGEPRQAQ
jgi:hypothetical protein